jgi:hypothetical protein
MAYMYKNGKVVSLSTSDIKLPKSVVLKVDSNKNSKHIVQMAVKSIQKANVKYAF